MTQRWLDRAIELATENVRSGKGGPFGAVVVQNEEVVAEGVNLVTAEIDPTAHAEVTAIRDACKKLKSFELKGCDIYASCEPCPMCLGAIYWTRLDRIWFAASRHDAAAAGFDDEFIYRELASGLSIRKIPLMQEYRPKHREPFNEWMSKQDRIRY